LYQSVALFAGLLGPRQRHVKDTASETGMTANAGQ
jgi:hypothetical protein